MSRPSTVFFVQAEAGIRDGHVTGVQTCALPISSDNGKLGAVTIDITSPGGEDGNDAPVLAIAEAEDNYINAEEISDGIQARSEERRVGKEDQARRSAARCTTEPRPDARHPRSTV